MSQQVSLPIDITGIRELLPHRYPFLLVDRVDRVPEAIAIARRSRRVALQAIGLGMGMSGLAMGVAAAGWLTPLAGALVLSAASVLSKAIIPGLILPIGVVTALVGVPFFFSLILSTRSRSW